MTDTTDTPPPRADTTPEDLVAVARLIRRWGGPTIIAALAAAGYTAVNVPSRLKKVEEDHKTIYEAQREVKDGQAYIMCYVRARAYGYDPLQLCAQLDPQRAQGGFWPPQAPPQAQPAPAPPPADTTRR